MFPTTANQPTSLAEALQKSNHVDTSSTAGGGKSFLQFSGNDGIFRFGREKEEINDELICINSYSFTHGWALWVDGQVEKRTVSFTEALPDAMPSKQNRKGQLQNPTQSRGFEARFLDEDDETILAYEGNSYGARSGCDALLTEVSARAAKGESEFLFPVVKLTNTSYKGPEGIVFNPIFDIQYWVDQDGNREPEQKKAIESPKEVEAEDADDAAPRRRRRRS